MFSKTCVNLPETRIWNNVVAETSILQWLWVYEHCEQCCFVERNSVKGLTVLSHLACFCVSWASVHDFSPYFTLRIEIVAIPSCRRSPDLPHVTLGLFIVILLLFNLGVTDSHALLSRIPVILRSNPSVFVNNDLKTRLQVYRTFIILLNCF